MPNKTVISNFNAIEEMIIWPMTHVLSRKIFKDFFSKLAEFLLIKLPNSPNEYNLQSVIRYYCSFTISNDICINNTSEEKV